MAILLCRSISGPVILDDAVDRLTMLDSIVDGVGSAALVATASAVQLERCTIMGPGRVHQLYGSEIILGGFFDVEDRQEGCLRYSRYEPGSRLPRRFQCVPGDRDGADSVLPVLNSKHFGNPAYGQLALICPVSIQTGAEDGAEMGAFHGVEAALRLKNLALKLDEYMPVGLTPVLIHVT